MIIFDLGSGNSCQNVVDKAREMVLNLAQCKIPGAVAKWQLFEKAGSNLPLDKLVFDAAYYYAATVGINTTASVFDKESLDFLLDNYHPAFVKLANNPASHALLKYIPEHKRVIISTDKPDFKTDRDNTDVIYTVSKYPAEVKDYDKFSDKLKKGMSDHTTNFDLFWKYQPKIYEVHFKLEGSRGLDAGPFARTPKQIEGLLKPPVGGQ